MTFQTIHTDYGLGRIAASVVSGIPINITNLAVGDGNGGAVTPAPTMTALVREVYRTTVNTVVQDPAQPTRYYVEALIPASVGGWTIREFGLFDDAGNLFAVSNFPSTYKSVPSDGASNDLVIRCVLIVSNAGVITLVVDPAVVVATRQWVLNNVDVESLIPGGLTGQVLTKQSNLDGDVDWENPADANILVNVVEEAPQTIASGQLTVTLSTCNTTGLAVYIEGVRIPRVAGVDGWQPSGGTQVVLGKQYPVGSVFTAFQNDPASNIPDPLTASQNLADVVSVAAARTNLDVFSKAEALQLQPAGNVSFSARTTPPTGWLVANGALVSRSTYATLFAAIGTTYGGGDGTTTFALPDLRGEFLRGWDNGRGVDVGRALGSAQAGQVQAHKHVAPIGQASVSGVGFGLFGTTDTAGKFGMQDWDNNNLWLHTNDGSNYDGTVNAAGVIGAETRPRNVAMLPIIKW